MMQVQQYRYTSFQNNKPVPLLFLNTYMWLTITMIIGTSVLFLELLNFLQAYKSCFYNHTLLHIKRLYLDATEIELDFLDDIPSALFLNLDQTPLSPERSLRGSIYFHQRGQKMFPLKGLMTKGKLQRLLQFLLQVPFCLFS